MKTKITKMSFQDKLKTNSYKKLNNLIYFCLIIATFSEASRIKDVARIDGIQEWQLIGYGLIVGLQGTGDQRNAPFTSGSIKNLVEEVSGVITDGRRTNTKNIASVIVTAKISTFKKTGTTIDVTISSIGDARSLAGGTLLPTALKGLNGKIYAVAQGTSITDNINSTNAHIINGAIVKQSIEVELKDTLYLVLNHPDFMSCVAVKDTINNKLGTEIARVIDASSIEIVVPGETHPVEFITQLEVLEVSLDRREKVVVNRITGAIISGTNIKLYPVKLNYKEFRIEVDEQTTVGNFIDMVYALGIPHNDIIALLMTLSASGAIESEIIII